MTDSELLAEAFEEHRDHLRAVAYRLLGSMTDADDAVQDTWLRLTGADTGEVENLGAWLTTVVARVSLNMLRSRRHRNEEPVGDSWPGAAEAAARAGAAAARGGPGPAGRPAIRRTRPCSRTRSVSPCWWCSTRSRRPSGSRSCCTTCSPCRSPRWPPCSGARPTRRGSWPAGPGPDRPADLARQREVASAFLAAARGGDLSALVALLDSDVTLSGDAAAVPSGRPALLRGADLVARGAVMASARAGHSQLALVDGAVGIVFAPAGLQVVLALTVSAERRITAIDVIADPDRLRRVRLAVLPG